MTKEIIGEGTGEFRGRSFRAEFQVLDTKTGEVSKERQTMPVTGRTKAEKKRCLREFREQLESEASYDARYVTVKDLAEHFLKLRLKDPDISKATVRKETTRLKVIVMHLGKIRLQELKPSDIKEMLGEIALGKTPSGKPASGTYRQSIFVTLKQMLDMAVGDDIITKNPCANIKAPVNDTEERDTLLPEQVNVLRRLLDALPLTPIIIAIFLALFAGLRRGEICAIRWKHFDTKVGTLRVDSSLSPDDGLVGMKGSKKSTRKFRVIPIPSFLVEILVGWKTQQSTLFELTLGIRQTDDSPIVSSREGGFMHPDNLDRAWKRFARRYGYSDFTLHQLRHTFATLLFAAGVNLKVVQYLMGHSDPNFTMKLYIHYMDHMGLQAREALDCLIIQYEQLDYRDASASVEIEQDEAMLLSA